MKKYLLKKQLLGVLEDGNSVTEQDLKSKQKIIVSETEITELKAKQKRKKPHFFNPFLSDLPEQITSHQQLNKLFRAGRICQ